MSNKVELTETQKTIDKYLQGMTTLYGFVTHRQFLKIYNRYNDAKLLKADLLEFSDKLCENNPSYVIYDKGIYNNTVDRSVIDHITDLQQGKKYYDPTEEEILNRIKPRYYERTPEVTKLQNFFANEVKVNFLVLNSLMYNIIFNIMTDEKVKDVYSILREYNIAFSGDMQDKFTELYNDVINNTRCWSNCGYTPNEMINN